MWGRGGGGCSRVSMCERGGRFSWQRTKGAGTRGKRATRPNVVLTLADVFGYECAGANGGCVRRHGSA